MTKFKYKARTRTGDLLDGELEADSKLALAGELNDREQVLVSVEEKPLFIDLSVLTVSFAKKAVRTRDLAVLFRQLSRILNAGIPFLSALAAVETQFSEGALRNLVAGIRDEVEAGSSFSSALARHPRIFSRLIIAMVAVGEKGGELPDILNKIALYLEKEYTFQQRVRGALRYPLLVLMTLAVAFPIMVLLIIPRFGQVFAVAGVKLPLPTRILLGVQSVLSNYWWAFIIAGFFSWYGFLAYRRSAAGRRKTDQLLLRLPVLGDLSSKLSISRFFRMLAVMISSGIRVVDALEITSGTADNMVISDAVASIRQEVLGGGTLSAGMQRCTCFPRIAVYMLVVGERTGEVDAMLLKSADYFDEETEYTISTLMLLLEPFLVLLLAGFVLLMALGIFLPMWSMLELYQ